MTNHLRPKASVARPVMGPTEAKMMVGAFKICMASDYTRPATMPTYPALFLGFAQGRDGRGRIARSGDQGKAELIVSHDKPWHEYKNVTYTEAIYEIKAAMTVGNKY